MAVSQKSVLTLNMAVKMVFNNSKHNGLLKAGPSN